MSTEEESAAFAAKIMETVGPAEALLMAMRLTLLVGQRAGDDPSVVAAATEAIDAIKRVGTLTGVFTAPTGEN